MRRLAHRCLVEGSDPVQRLRRLVQHGFALAAIARLLVVVMSGPSQFVGLDELFQRVGAHSQKRSGDLAPVREFTVVDVVALLLREAVKKNATVALTEGDKGPVSAASPLACAGYALFDKPAPEIGVDKAALGALSRVAKRSVADAFPAREAPELLGCVNRQVAPP